MLPDAVPFQSHRQPTEVNSIVYQIVVFNDDYVKVIIPVVLVDLDFVGNKKEPVSSIVVGVLFREKG